MFGKIGVAFGAGFILGPALGGLLGGIDPRLPFWVAAGLSFANALYGLLILPESLPPERRVAVPLEERQSAWARCGLLGSDRTLAGLSSASFFAQLAHVVLPSMYRSLCDLSLRLGRQDRRADIRAGRHLLDGGAGRGDRADRPTVWRAARAAPRACLRRGRISHLRAAPSGPLFWIGIPVLSLWGVAGAATQALATRFVSPEQQGQLQGATASVVSIAQLLGPFLFTLTFAYFIGESAPFKLPGASFLLASALLLLALAVALRTLAGRK